MVVPLKQKQEKQIQAFAMEAMSSTARSVLLESFRRSEASSLKSRQVWPRQIHFFANGAEVRTGRFADARPPTQNLQMGTMWFSKNHVWSGMCLGVSIHASKKVVTGRRLSTEFQSAIDVILLALPGVRNRGTHQISDGLVQETKHRLNRWKDLSVGR